MHQMSFVRFTGAMLRRDVLLIGRDSLLLAMLVMIVLIAVVLKYALPWADQALVDSGILPNASYTVRLSDLYPMLISFGTLFQGAVLAGTIFGFLLIEEKEDRTLTAMMVTPVSMQRYLLYRLSLPALTAFLFVPFQIWIIDLGQPSVWPLIAISFSAALLAPIVALFFAVVAENKIQGVAVSKFVSISGWIIIVAWFVPEPWQYALTVFPPFLTHKAWWLALHDNSIWWAPLVVSVFLQLVILVVLSARFRKSL